MNTMTRLAPAALVVLLLASAAALAQGAPRSGTGPCRQGALTLIRLLDDKQDNTADYRQVFDAVVHTCGPVAEARPAPAVQARGACRDLAVKVLDVIEDGKIRMPLFVQVRDTFKVSCPPR